MTPLAASDFPAFFQAIHGHPPFAWQERLLAVVLEDGWQRAISLPTASGKTAVLDIAVFALALEAAAKAPKRRTPRRIALVVDRRIVVDDAYRRAERIAGAVAESTEPILVQVADALRSLGGDAKRPLDCAALRGGIPRENRWARTPLQPVLLCSTVDQIGSRLLHRGYGISPHSWPIHAGLLGTDTLIILDEAHCSKPFQQTLEAVQAFRKRAACSLPQPWAFVPMTATPNSEQEPFKLTAEERSETIIARRLQASKPARLSVAAKKGDEGIADAAVMQLRADDSHLCPLGSTTLVVFNRVRAARHCYDTLTALAKRAAKGATGAKAFACIPILLTGRSRPLERDHMLMQHRERLMAGRNRDEVADQLPLIVIATQCVEVGADLDVDALITEACPMDSLRQRFGRLDRLGDRGTSPAHIICRPDLAGDAASQNAVDDPVYGSALSRTWWWLQEQASEGVIDCGVAALDALEPPMAELAAPSSDAPLIFPAYCDLWVQTGPAPAVSPDPALFLHGPQAGPPSVNIVWRGDLCNRPALLWNDIIAASPPMSGEALPVPLYLARAWLAEQAKIDDQGGDVEGRDPRAESLEDQGRHQALAWRGVDRSTVVTANGIRPGDTLVVPSDRGGADAAGWTGRNDGPVSDLFEAARIKSQRPSLLRLCSDTGPFPEAITTAFPKALADLPADGNPPDPAVLKVQISSFLADVHGQLSSLDLSDDLATIGLRETIAGLMKDTKLRWEHHPGGRGLILSSSKRLSETVMDFSDEDDDSSLAKDQSISLTQHLQEVRDWADHIARSVCLPDELIHCLALAGHLHDLGKADRRFQAWLKGGSRFQVDPDNPLAKSDQVRSGAAANRARKRSGYPQGGRHELLSVRLAEQAPDLLPSDPVQRDLVLHLVASHHGRCRPWAPAVEDPLAENVSVTFAGHTLQHSSASGLERVDSGVAERFWRLVEHYGWWGLSYLDACLRLADHRASECPNQAPKQAAAQGVQA